jgi:chemotaxis protein CheD
MSTTPPAFTEAIRDPRPGMPGSPAAQGPSSQNIVIGVGEMAVSGDPDATLSTYALGSCMAVVAYDARARVGGILHLMLPDSTIAPAKAAARPAMFANTGIPCFLAALLGLDAEPSHLRLFVTGGASVLSGNDAFKIGARNIRATQEGLRALGLAFGSASIGGTLNRTVHLANGTGAVTLTMPTASEEHFLGS